MKARCCGYQNNLCGCQNLPLIDLLEVDCKGDDCTLLMPVCQGKKSHFVKFLLSILVAVKSWKLK